MTSTPIQAIIFDNNGTLRRTVRRSDAEKAEWIKPLQQAIGSTRPPAEFVTLLTERLRAYRRWSLETLTNLDEQDLWAQWMLPDYPPEQIRPLARELNRLWRQANGVPVIFPEARPVLMELFRRGYRLGIASNTISSSDIPEMLHGLRLAGYFETVLLSGEFGKRKPDPALLSEAAKQIHQPPSACAYIGNRTDRDVIAARGAGYAKVVLLRDPAAPHLTAPDGDLQADDCIDSLSQLLEIFPQLNGTQPQPRPYCVSLSTMWAIKNFDRLEDFLIAAGRYGYGQVELNHQISPQMLEGINLARYPIASIHEPCPAEPSMDELKQRDWLISSPDEAKRMAGVACVKRSIDLAHRLGISVIVVHGGQVVTPQTMERQLRALYADGKKGTPEYEELKARMIAERERVIAPHFEAVKKSVKELLAYAAPLGVRLGLENRYHWTDIPTQDEMEELLALGKPEQIGFIFDSGHATALDRMGFYSLDGWLTRFSHRMVGCHLHDVVGLDDHYAPGLGDVDFDLIARHLPPGAFRTVELKTSNTPAEVIAGAHFLAQKGIITPLV